MTSIEERAISPWPSDVLSALRRFKLGDLVAGVPFVYHGAVEDGLPLDYPPAAEAVEDEESDDDDAPRDREFDTLAWDPPDGEGYAIITTQTCDLCEEGEPRQPWFMVSPVRQMSGEHATRTLPGFMYPISPPDLPAATWAVDLRMEVPVEKTFLVGKKPIAGFADERGLIDFADALGRRRDRAALASSLVEAVGSTLRQRRRSQDGFKNMLRREVYSVRLRIEDGSREDPRSVVVHVFTRGAVSDNVQTRFDEWWDEAREACERVGITLLPTRFHPCEADLDIYEDAIPLDLG